MSTKRWNTQVIKAALEALPGIKKVEATTQGGDVDTTNLVVTPAGKKTDKLHVCGFVTDSNYITTPDDVDVEMIEVSDGMDSRGGLNSSSLETAQAYAQICTYFRKAGYDVVPCLKDYF